jgi:hypothetical protein
MSEGRVFRVFTSGGGGHGFYPEEADGKGNARGADDLEGSVDLLGEHLDEFEAEGAGECCVEAGGKADAVVGDHQGDVAPGFFC